MPVIYWHQDDDPSPQIVPLHVEEESDSWWSGVQKSFASVALASVLAVTAQATAIAGTIVRDVEELPANTLSTIPEDDSWKPPTIQPQYRFVPAPNPDQDEYPHLQDDEYWINPVRPQPLTIFQQLPLGDPEEIPAGSLKGQPDEDFWQNPAAPIPASMWQRLPLGDPEELPANTLRGQPDEDFWINPVAPLPASMWQPLPLGDRDEIYSFTAAIPEEDFWRNPAAPVPASMWQRLPIGDVEELPAGSFSTIPEDDSWFLGPRPLALTFNWPQQFSFDQPEAPQTPSQIAEEDYWQNQVRPVPASQYQKLPYIPDPEEIPAKTLSTIPEDDSWQLGPRPRFGPSFVPQPWSFDAVETVCVLYEEDWQQGPRPIPASMYQCLPYLPDPEEISAKTLRGVPEEELWITRPRPTVYPTFLPTFSPFDLAESAGGGTSFVIWIGDDDV